MNLSSIVCAIDSSEASAIVLASAMALAESDRAELQIVHLAETASQDHPPPPVIRERFTAVVRGGDPAAAVIDRARKVRADLIVVGTALSAPGVNRLGSLGEAIAREAHCPTLIVPSVAMDGEIARMRSFPHRVRKMSRGSRRQSALEAGGTRRQRMLVRARGLLNVSGEE